MVKAIFIVKVTHLRVRVKAIVYFIIYPFLNIIIIYALKNIWFIIYLILIKNKKTTKYLISKQDKRILSMHSIAYQLCYFHAI